MWEENSRLALLRSLRRVGRLHPRLVSLGRVLGLRRLLRRPALARVSYDSGIELELDLSVRGFRYLYYSFDFDSAPEMALIRRIVNQDMCFVDIGANIGVWTLPAAKRAARVLAFEPASVSFSRLLRNLSLNASVEAKVSAHALAVGEKSGFAFLNIDVHQPELARVSPQDPGMRGERVAVTTLDAALEDQHDVANLTMAIKIDIEGAELSALLGGRQTLATWRPYVICELFDPHQESQGASCEEIVGFFRDQGYLAYSVGSSPSSRDLLFPLDLTRLSRKFVNTGFFVPTERTDAISAATGGDTWQ